MLAGPCWLNAFTEAAPTQKALYRHVLERDQQSSLEYSVMASMSGRYMHLPQCCSLAAKLVLVYAKVFANVYSDMMGILARSMGATRPKLTPVCRPYELP